MKCKDVEKGLIAFVDERASATERRDVEAHLAGCAACRTRVEQFRSISNLLGEVPALEPSFGFDARVRQRVAAEPQRASWFAWFVPQARLALSAAMLVALTVWMVKLPASRPPAPTPQPTAATAPSEQDFDAIKDLGVLENYDVLTKFDALSESATMEPHTHDKTQSGAPSSND